MGNVVLHLVFFFLRNVEKSNFLLLSGTGRVKALQIQTPYDHVSQAESYIICGGFIFSTSHHICQAALHFISSTMCEVKLKWHFLQLKTLWMWSVGLSVLCFSSRRLHKPSFCIYSPYLDVPSTEVCSCYCWVSYTLLQISSLLNLVSKVYTVDFTWGLEV